MKTTYRIEWSNDVYKDCSEALKINSNITKDYLIQPNLKAGVIKVACENRNGKVFAVVEHDSQSQNFVHGYEKPGSYKKAIKYKVDVKKIKALINYSKECRQFTKAVCKGSFLSNLNKWPKPTWLEGYKHKKLNFWGGGPSNGRGCACGIKKKCVQPKLKCNCDINTHDKWRTDEGYITDKSVLPITVVRVGDTGDAKEQLIFQIGKLECVM